MDALLAGVLVRCVIAVWSDVSLLPSPMRHCCLVRCVYLDSVATQHRLLETGRQICYLVSMPMHAYV